MAERENCMFGRVTARCPWSSTEAQPVSKTLAMSARDVLRISTDVDYSSTPRREGAATK